MANHTIRCAVQLARASGSSLALLFIDYRTAYYAALRELIMPMRGGTEAAEEAIAGMTLPPALVELLKRNLEQPSLLEQLAEARPEAGHLVDQLVDVHTNTWFCVQHAPGPAVTRRGTRPGDSLADVLFGVLLAPVLDEVGEGLEEAGLAWVQGPAGPFSAAAPRSTAPPLSPPRPQRNTDITYADDVVYEIWPNAPHRVLEDLAFAVTLAVRAAGSKGLVVNDGPGKSALLLVMRGRLSCVNRRAICADRGGKIADTAGYGVEVPVVRQYKYLGSQITDSGTLQPEIAARRSAQAGAVVSLRKAVFERALVETSTKAQLANALATSRLMYLCHVWPKATESELKAFAAAYAVPFRAATRTGRHPTSHHIEEEALHRAGQLSVQTRLTMARLRYLPRLLANAPAQLHFLLDALLARGIGWPMLIQEDCQKLADWTPEQKPEAGEQIAAWVAAAGDDRRQWVSRCTLAAKRAARADAEAQLVAIWSRGLEQTCRDAGLTTTLHGSGGRGRAAAPATSGGTS